jgi:energy-converting hydrogenase Eha subunit C
MPRDYRFEVKPCTAQSSKKGGLIVKPTSTAILFSHPLDKTIDHALLAGAIELDRQLVAVDRGDVAVAEFLMEDAVAE